MTKHNFLYLFIALFIFVSCSDELTEIEDQDDLNSLQDQLFYNPGTIAVKEFSNYIYLFEDNSNISEPDHLEILESVAQSFPNDKIRNIVKFMSSDNPKKVHYSVFLDNEIEAVVFQEGQLLVQATIEKRVSENEITAGELPFKSILRIHKDHKDEIIEEVRSINNNRFRIDFKNGISIELNRRGSEQNRDFDDNGDDDGIEIDPATLPQAIHDYVAANYPDLTIVEAEQYPDGYEVELSNGLQLEFDLSGVFIEISGKVKIDDEPNGEDGEDIDPANLPQPILDYVALNYPGATITAAEQYPEGYEVTLSNGLKLEFNINGDFIEISGHSDDDSQDDEDDDEVIPVSDLPQIIIDYINTNYPDETILRAELDINGYDVILSNGLKLEFDLDGNFIEVSGGLGDDDNDDGDSELGEDIDPSTLPDTILSFIADVCPTETIVAAEIYPEGYEVTMSSGLSFEFDVDGIFTDISGSDCEEIPISDLPQEIFDWIASNFTSAIDKVKECDFGYRIDLDDDTRIWLKANGDVIFIGVDD